MACKEIDTPAAGIEAADENNQTEQDVQRIDRHCTREQEQEVHAYTYQRCNRCEQADDQHNTDCYLGERDKKINKTRLWQNKVLQESDEIRVLGSAGHAHDR